MPADSIDHRRLGRIGGLSLHATHDSDEIAARARAGFHERFIGQTDPALPMPERLRRAHFLMRAHMARMALRSAEARRKRAAAAKPWRYPEDDAANFPSEESAE